MTAEIAIVVSSRDWAEALHRFVADHGGARVRARVLDGREALEEPYQVLVAEDLTSFLTPRLVTLLQRDGRRVMGVYSPDEPWGRSRLDQLGVDETTRADASPDEMLRTIEALALGARADVDAELARLAPGAATPAVVDAPGPPRGAVVAVGGPSGGPGATEIAIGVADALVRHRRSAVVVDADDVAPSVAQRLGLALHPNLRTAVDAVHHLSGRLVECLLPTRRDGPDVLGGLADARDWSELRPHDVVAVVRELAAVRAGVVVNVGHRLEAVSALGGGDGRYGLARTLLGDADVVVGVCAPTPVGLARFLDWLADVRAVSRAPIVVLVNQAAPRSFVRRQLEDELRRNHTPPVFGFVPPDRRVETAAWAGELVAAGAFTRSLDWFTDRLLATTRPRTADQEALA